MGKITILLVENDKPTQLLLNKFLVMSNFTVLVAENGKQAIENYLDKQCRIDFVITDIMMPEVNGLELLMYIRKQELYQQTPVIGMTSGYSDYLKSISQEKFDALLTKPLDLDHLLVCIESVMQQQAKKQ
ncbi:response regulator [Pedobacter sp. HMWF019]|uniref:response regulator n=1 Tax=Pedobacter sp. HMWF019 TaxID=2056856 RepID=UPI0011B28477|nr:response regulator [Pedobacter sp. HMWF019]